VSGEYEAGNGEDKVYIVLREGRPPVNVRSRPNAMIMAREATNEGGLVAVFNTLELKFELMSDFVDIPQDDKDAIAAAKDELKKVRAQVADQRRKLLTRNRKAPLRVVAA
jgi:hypothetical protein